MRNCFARFVSKRAALARAAGVSMVLALGGATSASAGVIFDNITGTSSPSGYLVGQYPGGGIYAIGFDFTAPSNAGPAVGGAIGVEYSSGLNQLDLTLAENVGGAVGPTVATATLTAIPATLTILDFSLTSSATLTPGASYWLIATADDPSAVFYWWTPNIPVGSFDQIVSVNGGAFTFDQTCGPGNSPSSASPNRQPGRCSSSATLELLSPRAAPRSGRVPGRQWPEEGREGGDEVSALRRASRVRHPGSRDATRPSRGRPT